jgi:hypothetical protein
MINLTGQFKVARDNFLSNIIRRRESKEPKYSVTIILTTKLPSKFQQLKESEPKRLIVALRTRESVREVRIDHSWNSADQRLEAWPIVSYVAISA